MNHKGILNLLILVLFFSVLLPANGQISAPGSSGTVVTEYPAFPEADSIFVFCIQEEGNRAATLLAQTALPGSKTFVWEKYNPATGSFDQFLSESSEGLQSTVSGLDNGGYRVTISQGETTEIYRSWVFNNLISANAAITGSSCTSFTLQGEFSSTPLLYYDLSNNTPLEVFKDLKAEWLKGGEIVSMVLEHVVFSPPAENTEYTLRVYDRLGCESTSRVLYESIVPVAAFTANPMEGEAPLTVTFTNQSKNANPNLYEWFFYRDLDDIKRESEKTQVPIDSIMIVAYEQAPVYTYENSGTYKVKLVAKKSSGLQTCVDTAFIEGFIRVDTSFVSVPNVFTPNGDGSNDMFIVKFWSMQSLKISIFNRWGKRIHFWENSNVRGFENAYTATVWDGRLGGRFASPGVYYYIVEGKGRDDKSRKAHGFFHLFRGDN